MLWLCVCEMDWIVPTSLLYVFMDNRDLISFQRLSFCSQIYLPVVLRLLRLYVFPSNLQPPICTDSIYRALPSFPLFSLSLQLHCRLEV
jgi:hypothetical protein